MFKKEYALSLPQLGVSRDPCTVKCLYLGLSAIIPTHSDHIFSQSILCILHPTFVGDSLHSFSSFFSHPSCLFSYILDFLQLGLEIQNQLFLGGQLNFHYVEQLALVLGLGLSVFQTGQGTRTFPFGDGQLIAQLLVLLFQGSKSLLNLKTRVGLSLNLVTGIPDPLRSYINLLGNLHKSSKQVIKNIYIYE